MPLRDREPQWGLTESRPHSIDDHLIILINAYAYSIDDHLIILINAYAHSIDDDLITLINAYACTNFLKWSTAASRSLGS